MSQLGGNDGNIGLISSRAVNDLNFAHCFVANEPVDKIFISSKTSTNAYVFPLFVHVEDVFGKKRRANFSRNFLKLIAQSLSVESFEEDGLPKGITSKEIFHYIYAVLHSPTYRRRYAEFLKVDFPRLPLTGSREMFRAMARLGGELVAVHLLESSQISQTVCEFSGTPMAEKISWSMDTVWIDKAQTAGFRGVYEDVWNFHVGGYQVCEKWLKDRKGRRLSKSDISHYQKIVGALAATNRLMKEVDETIEAHGGWTNAFSVLHTAKH